MVSEIFFALTFLGLIQGPQKVSNDLDVATTARMQQRAEELQARMMQLLQEIEKRDQEHGWARVGTLLLSVLQHWHFCVLTGGIVLFFVLCCMLTKFCREWRSRTKKDISGRKDDDDSEEDPSDILDARRFVNEYLQWPVRNLGGTCKVVEELVNNLLATCQGLPRNKFMPRLQPAIVVGSASGPTERDTICRLLVPLNPPPGHAFHLELGTEGERLARNSCLRVELQCMCTREQMLGDVLCFLHHPKHELKDQDPTLLDTLCCGSYLDVQKTAKWFQELVAEAWGAMPQSAQLQLTMLPATRFCKFMLTNASNERLSVKLMLGVKEDDSDTYLTFEETTASLNLLERCLGL
ncbi:Inositol 1,4,5-trisphosphate receptor-interacting protein-like 1 [Aix galericulata]|nr:Inositol 1,4,5-trisphosphate receptor-interacting protein-like 1 [Aix galericulata]